MEGGCRASTLDSALELRMETGRGLSRTRQRSFITTKKRPCKDTLRAGTTLAIMRERMGTTTTQ